MGKISTKMMSIPYYKESKDFEDKLVSNGFNVDVTHTAEGVDISSKVKYGFDSVKGSLNNINSTLKDIASASEKDFDTKIKSGGEKIQAYIRKIKTEIETEESNLKEFSTADRTREENDLKEIQMINFLNDPGEAWTKEQATTIAKMYGDFDINNTTIDMSKSSTDPKTGITTITHKDGSTTQYTGFDINSNPFKTDVAKKDETQGGVPH